MEKERAAILEVDKQWAKAAAEGRDVNRIVSFWADDAVILAPGVPAIKGKDAIHQFVQQSLATPGFSIRWKTTDVVVSPDGTFAFATGKNVITFLDPQSKLVTAYGKAVTIWRKNDSGMWKCVVDIWNEDPQVSE